MTEKFDKKLTTKILPRFATAKEWPDLMTICNCKRVARFNDNIKKIQRKFSKI